MVLPFWMWNVKGSETQLSGVSFGIGAATFGMAGTRGRKDKVSDRGRQRL